MKKFYMKNYIVDIQRPVDDDALKECAEFFFDEKNELSDKYLMHMYWICYTFKKQYITNKFFIY
jgi:hypothetical protein